MIELILFCFVTIFITITHSIFGAGILTFGMPLLLSVGYSYNYTISFLVPLSFVISMLVVWEDRKIIFSDPFVKTLSLYSLPLVLCFSWLSLTYSSPNELKFIIGIFLFISGLARLSDRVRTPFYYFIRKLNIFGFILMGAVQGFASMGGALLIPLVTMNHQEKEKVRALNSFAFAAFTIMQMVMMFGVKGQVFSVSFFVYIILGILAHYVLGQRIHKKIDLRLFYNLLTFLMIFNSVVLLAQYFIH